MKTDKTMSIILLATLVICCGCNSKKEKEISQAEVVTTTTATTATTTVTTEHVLTPEEKEAIKKKGMSFIDCWFPEGQIPEVVLTDIDYNHKKFYFNLKGNELAISTKANEDNTHIISQDFELEIWFNDKTGETGQKMKFSHSQAVNIVYKAEGFSEYQFNFNINV